MVKNAEQFRKDLVRSLPLYFMLLPGLIYIFINNYIPMAGIVVAFKKYSAQLGIWGSKWVGFSNFTYLFRNDASILISGFIFWDFDCNHCNGCFQQKGKKSISERNSASFFGFHSNCKLYRICFFIYRKWDGKLGPYYVGKRRDTMVCNTGILAIYSLLCTFVERSRIWMHDLYCRNFGN